MEFGSGAGLLFGQHVHIVKHLVQGSVGRAALQPQAT